MGGKGGSSRKAAAAAAAASAAAAVSVSQLKGLVAVEAAVCHLACEVVEMSGEHAPVSTHPSL